MTVAQIARVMTRAQASLQMLSHAQRELRAHGALGPEELADLAQYRAMEHNRVAYAALQLRALAAANEPAMEALPA